MISFNDTTSYVSFESTQSNSIYDYSDSPIVYSPTAMLVIITDNNNDTFLVETETTSFILIGDELTTYLNSLPSNTRIEYTDVDSLLVV